MAQVAHHLETATSVWSAAELAAALPAPELAAEDAGSENAPPATEPQTARCPPSHAPARTLSLCRSSPVAAAHVNARSQQIRVVRCQRGAEDRQATQAVHGSALCSHGKGVQCPCLVAYSWQQMSWSRCGAGCSAATELRCR